MVCLCWTERTEAPEVCGVLCLHLPAMMIGLDGFVTHRSVPGKGLANVLRVAREFSSLSFVVFLLGAMHRTRILSTVSLYGRHEVKLTS
jgi:hypothetical protein